ncbi:hypothetical protein NPIL_557611 [Nephila pilipes]|uniref:Uncharacterized protein n=1 Tax=Nephila pilipes TaxID=299642 RepID=A0A8X6J4C7_NEPPI|nr:hypothetical protein NPIL_557611 [Nephila pilipes]
MHEKQNILKASKINVLENISETHSLVANDYVSNSRISFFIDSGASQHRIKDANIFSSLDDSVESIIIIVADVKSTSSRVVKNYLEINIRRDSSGNVLINQRKKIENLLEKIIMKDHKPTSIPMDTSYSKNEDYTENLEYNSEYRQEQSEFFYISLQSQERTHFQQ